MSANGKEIADYIAQRKDDYTKAKEREREAAKVSINPSFFYNENSILGCTYNICGYNCWTNTIKN
jgi:hypothetical protein